MHILDLLALVAAIVISCGIYVFYVTGKTSIWVTVLYGACVLSSGWNGHSSLTAYLLSVVNLPLAIIWLWCCGLEGRRMVARLRASENLHVDRRIRILREIQRDIIKKLIVLNDGDLDKVASGINLTRQELASLMQELHLLDADNNDHIL